MLAFKTKPSVFRVFEKAIALTLEDSSLSLTVLNDLVPVDFSVDEMELLFDELWNRGISVLDEQRQNQNIEPFLRKGQLSSPIVDENEIAEEMELLKNPLKSYFRKINEFSTQNSTFSEPKGERKFSSEQGDFTSSEIKREFTKEELIEAHLGLVVKIARKYKRSGVSFMELILAGNEGLVEAANHYCSCKNKSFLSTARWWVSHRLSKCVAENWRASRVPKSVAVDLRRVARVVARYRGKRGCEPSVKFLARALSIDEEEVYFLKSLFSSPLSLYGPAASDVKDVLLIDTVVDQNAINGESVVEAVCSKERVVALLERLDPLQKQVISLRYGFDDDISKSTAQVAMLLGVSVELVRATEVESLKKISFLV